jgi:hypothetical protein
MMAPMVAALSDEDVSNISAYYASLEGALGTSTFEHVDAGKKLYQAGKPLQALPPAWHVTAPQAEEIQPQNILH